MCPIWSAIHIVLGNRRLAAAALKFLSLHALVTQQPNRLTSQCELADSRTAARAASKLLGTDMKPFSVAPA